MLQMFLLPYMCSKWSPFEQNVSKVRLVTMCQAYPKITISTFSLFPIPTFNPSFLFLNHRTDRSVIQLSPLSFNACPSNLKLAFIVKSSVCFNCSNWYYAIFQYIFRMNKILTISSPPCFFVSLVIYLADLF